MTRIDVLEVRGNGVRTGTGAMVAFLTGRGRAVGAEDPDGNPLLRVEKTDEWYARRPDGETLLRIDWSLSRLHAVTYADGRTGRFDAGPHFGAWELTGSALDVHARWAGNPLTAPLDWTCAQNGALTTLDFLATVVTYRALTRQRQSVDSGQVFP